MRGKQGYRQTRDRNIRVVFVGVDAVTADVNVNTATPASLNGTNPSIIFSGFQSVLLPQNAPTADLPTLRIANDGNKFALLPFAPDISGVTPTTSQILLSATATSWRTKTLPTRTTADPLKHAWAEVYGRNGRFIVSHSVYPDIVVFDNNNNLTLLQDVFAVNGFPANGIAAGGGMLLAAADDAKVIYRSTDNGLTWIQVAANVLINEFSATPTVKTLDRVLALTYGADGNTNVFFMLAKRDDVSRYRYVLTSTDGVNWTQRLRVDLGVTGTPQEPIIASSSTRTVILFNNLITATTIVTTTSASIWTQLSSTPAANWRGIVYDGAKFVATGEPFSTTATPLVMTLSAAATSWTVKLTGTQKLRCVGVGSTAQVQPDGSVTLFLKMAGTNGSNVFVDSSGYPKTITATNVTLTDTQTKWPGLLSADFASVSVNSYLSVAGSPDITFGLDDFTLELWVWLNSYSPASNGAVFWDANPINTNSYRSAGFAFYFSGNGELRLYQSGNNIVASSPGAIPLEEWAHIALVRKNGKTTIYINGSTAASTTTQFNATAAAGGSLVGRFCDNGNAHIDGYIGELRIIKNVAIYTTPTFAVPTAPLLNYIPLGAPINVAAMSDNQQIFLSWTSGLMPNGTTVLGHSVQQSTDNGTTWITSTTAATTNNSAVITNLTNGTLYRFRVAVLTEDGVGPYSTELVEVLCGGDVDFQNVLLLLRMDGANGSTTFTDASGAPKNATLVGDTQISTAQSKFGGASALFQNGYLSFGPDPDFALGLGDFTIEMWAYFKSYNQAVLWETSTIGSGQPRPNALLWYLNNDGSLDVFHNGNHAIITNAEVVPLSQWTHLALVRSAGITTTYVDGISVGSTNYAINATLGYGLISMGQDGAVWQLDGYIDEFRITKNVARYSGSSFAVPAFPFPVDGPLTAPTNLRVFSADQQLELLWAAPRTKGYSTIVDYNVQYSADNGDTWTTVTDGVSAATTTTITGLTNNTPYLVRVAAVTGNGTGPYVTTQNAISPTNGDLFFNDVALLLRFDASGNSFVDDSPRPKSINIFGNAAINYSVSKWGAGSCLFTGGFLQTSLSEDFVFGTGDFTMECWAYPQAQTFAGGIFGVGYYYNGVLFRQRSDYPYDSLYLNSVWVSWDPLQNLPTNVWTHVALVRENGLVSVYANGTRVLQWNNVGNIGPTSASSSFATIGAGAHSGYGEPFSGYIDELRITKGVARYSGITIQVPTGPFLGAGT